MSWNSFWNSVGTALRDLLDWVSPNVSDMITKSVRKKDIELLEKALNQAITNYSNEYYLHPDNPELTRERNVLNGIVNSIYSSAPDNLKHHYKVLRDKVKNVEKLEKDDETKRIIGQSQSDSRKDTYLNDINTLQSAILDTDPYIDASGEYSPVLKQAINRNTVKSATVDKNT